jgi:taurine dioxygenase
MPLRMEMERITVLGAEVHGVNLGLPVGEEMLADIQAALATHGVLVFRDQDLSAAQLVALARRFGEPFVQPVFADRYQELLILENDEKRRPVLNFWHHDMTGLAEPPGAHFLHALEVPDGGGDTLWSCNLAAFESLSDGMQRFLSGMTATHSVLKAYARAFSAMPDGERRRREIAERCPPVHHPVIRTHPVTGRKGIFVNSTFTECIDGLSEKESRVLLEFLYGLIATPEFCMRLRWRVGTLAIWDNRRTCHYAVADYFPQRRKMQRASVCGERPA